MFSFLKKVMFVLMMFVFCLCSDAGEAVSFASTLQNERTSEVILGGQVVGFEYTPNGVLVLSVNGEVNNVLKVGDILSSIDDEPIYSSGQIENLLNGKQKGQQIKITYYRDNKECVQNFRPHYDLLAQKFVLGVWVKDQISGIGTLTYINPNTGYFGSLGHPITVGGQTKHLSVKEGMLYSCSVLGVQKGGKGSPGELRGFISKSKIFGKVVKNTEFGVFGTITDKGLLKNNKRLVGIGGRKTIKPGKAQIYCSIEDGETRAYDIQIIKTNYQNVSNDKSLVFKVLDEELIQKTGGIVQGMSGSPIVQNGKLVGAVTHVFTNDSTKGFGIYIDWMM